MIAQVMTMGVDEQQARAALDATRWVSIEAAVAHLFGT